MAAKNSRTWAEELDYITREADRQIFASFNYDAACFARYCDMQARGAEKDGNANIAEAIRAIANETAGVR